MPVSIQKLAARGDMLMRMMTHAGRDIMPQAISAFRGNTGATTLSNVVGELRKAHGMKIPLANLSTAQSSLSRLPAIPQTPTANLMAMPRLSEFSPLLDPKTSQLMQGRLKYGSDKRDGFIYRLTTRHGLTQTQAEAFTSRLEKSAFGLGDAGNLAFEFSGIPSMGRGISDFGDAASMAGHGDFMGAIKRTGSALGHTALGLGGWIPGIGWAGKGLTMAGRGLAGVRGAGMAAKALNVAGRGAQAFKGYDLVGRAGAMSKGVGRLAGRLGPEFANIASGAENFGQHLTGTSAAWRAPTPFGPPLPGTAGLRSWNPMRASTYADRFSAFRTPGAARNSAQADYVNHAKFSWPLNTGLVAGPMALAGGGGEMPEMAGPAVDPRWSRG